MGRIIDEGVEVRLLAPDRRDEEVAKLVDPWIGDEGPLDAGFRRGGDVAAGGVSPGTLRPRGFAFDDTATVVWDEAGVQIVRAVPSLAPDADTVTLRSPVILHHRFAEHGPTSLVRIDYLRRGSLLGSRFSELSGPERGGDDA